MTAILTMGAAFGSFGAARSGAGEIGPGAEQGETGPTETQDSQNNQDQNRAEPEFSGSFEVNRFVLPEGARVLVVVEGTGGSNCQVYAYEYREASAAAPGQPEEGTWELCFETAGYLGRNGMSNHRTEGDKTTPIGLFQLNTPFGQAAPLEGFPENYIQVGEDYVWSDQKNILVKDPTATGERVGTAGYSEYYDYVLDAGYNKNAAAKKGSALFIHCHGHGRTETSGCISIPKEKMEILMKLYGAYGEGACYIAQAPKGTFGLIYDSYGVNDGLSPEGEFGV